MTANQIYYGTPLVPQTKALGYGTVPGADGNWFVYNRGSLLPTTVTSVWFMMHFKINTTVGQTLPLCGWTAGYGSLLIAADNCLQMYVRKTAGTAIGNARCPNPIPNLVPGRWIWVFGVVHIPSATCYYYYSHGELYQWTYLGGLVGTSAGGPLVNVNTDQIIIGSRGTTPWVPLTWDYFEEYIDSTSSVVVDLRERDTLPANTSIVGSATFTPRVRKSYPPVFKDLYLGGPSSRAWPLRQGQSLQPDGIVDLYQGATRGWPGADGYATFPGSVGNYLSSSSAVTAVTSNKVTAVARIRPTDWTPTAAQTIISRYRTGDLAFAFRLETTGQLRIFWYTGSISLNETSTANLSAAPLAWLWVAVSFDATVRTARFWTAHDDDDWAELGTPAGSGSSTIRSSTGPVDIGCIDAGLQQNFSGDISWASINDGVGPGNTPGGTEVFRFNRDSFKVAKNATSLAGTPSITVNRSGSPSTQIYPTVSEMEALWDVSQFNDGTLWTA